MVAVLVVEDEDVLLDMVAAIVEDLGHRPILATNGQEALVMLEKEAELPALIMSDVMMPQMNGAKLAEILRSDPRFRGIPLILMSAAASPPPAHLYDHFVAKPFNIEQVEDLISHYLGRG